MERRLTALVLPALIIALVWMMYSRNPQEPASAPTATPAAQAYAVRGPQAEAGDIVVHDFGAPGGPGYRVSFDRRGGAVREIRLLDHYVSVAARDKSEHDTEDYYPIVQPSPAGVLLLVLEEASEQRAFARVRIDEKLEKVGDAPDAREDHTRWQIDAHGDEVRLTLDCKDGRTLEKVFRYEPGRRDLELEIRLSSTRADDPDLGTAYPLRLRGVMLPNPKSEHVIGGSPAFAIAGWHDRTAGKDAHIVKRQRDLDGGKVETLVTASTDATIGWGGSTNRFFAGLVAPADESSRDALTVIRAQGMPAPADAHANLLAYSVPYPRYGLRLAVPKAGETSSVRLRLFLGPKSFGAFAAQPEYAVFEPVMTEDLTPPGCFNVCNIPGVTWMATNLLRLLEFLHGIVGNWGVAIILLTVLVKIAVFFLNFRSQKAMRAFGAKMARVKPELDAIQAKYKDDQKQLQQEMMLLYRKHKMFPPLGGCLPMFLTIPVFFGLFTALRVSYDLRHQPFVLWIKDLSAPDAMFDLSWLGWNMLPHFNLLPLVWMVLYSIMMFRMKLPTDPQQRTMQMVMRWMFLLFGVLLYNYASGLLVYMCTSMSLAFFEQWLIKKILGPMPEMPGVPTAMPQF
ncbi:MAG: membrane protein insertase YidC [Planctomycetota bacterium]